MRIVIDEDLPRSLGDALADIGHEIFDIRDYGLRGKPDSVIFAFAQRHHAVLCSADLGFADVRHFSLGSHAGILLLRFPNELSTIRMNTIVKSFLRKIPDSAYAGNLIILEPHRIRIRRSP